ncbi:MAG: O-antigen ligase family protein [Scytonema sp. PMC 1069.18]|nr:O-antigen ligase family protein [Scytonema sp. PMC 1069.18]MEC4880629.1 O-antigen ligase family protein [Scytonema sp. PMC 1070.18]
MKKFLRFAEQGFAILGLLFLSGAFGIGSMGDVLPAALVSLIRYLVWFGSTIIVVYEWKKTLLIGIRDLCLLTLTLLSLLSFSWSIFPDFTYSNMKEVLMMTFFGIYLATRFSLKEQVQLIAQTLLIGAFLSIFFALVIPGVGKHGADHPGAWKGIFGYKNNLGSMMVLNSLAFFSLPKKTPFLYRWGVFVLSLVLMLLSTSKTSLVLSFLLIFMISFYKNFRWQGKISVIFVDIGVLVLGCVSVIVLSNWVEIISGLGKDPTITGRTPLWSHAIYRLMERPFFGYGRGAYWAPGSKYAYEARVADWIPPHAHNGFIDIALDIGLIGLSLFLISYLITFFISLKRAYGTEDREELLPLAFLILLAMNNMTESYLMHLTNLYWPVYISFALTLRKKKPKPKLATPEKKLFSAHIKITTR